MVSLALLGLVTRVLAGGVIVGFRLLVEGAQRAMLPGGQAEGFESLAIVGGHSVGREGPIVFLGAASGSLLGTRLMLPHNVTRTLVGCGTAAGIAASFNTPLAGVVFGNFPAFDVPPVALGSLWDLVPVVVLGIAAGALSAGFIQAVQSATVFSGRWPIELRLVLAGVLMAGFGLALPPLMGIGYDSVGAALHGEYTASFLLLLLLGKLLATSCVIGLGVPGGTIGPTLFMGAMLGALFGTLAGYLPLTPEHQVGLFALLGLGAMMSGSLQAPLAALTAMLELTDNPGIILPGMLVVVIAGLTASEVFGKESQFLTMLRTSGLNVGNDPLTQALRRSRPRWLRTPIAIDRDRRRQRSSRHRSAAAIRGMNCPGFAPSSSALGQVRPSQ